MEHNEAANNFYSSLSQLFGRCICGARITTTSSRCSESLGAPRPSLPASQPMQSSHKERWTMIQMLIRACLVSSHTTQGLYCVQARPTLMWLWCQLQHHWRTPTNPDDGACGTINKQHFISLGTVSISVYLCVRPCARMHSTQCALLYQVGAHSDACLYVHAPEHTHSSYIRSDAALSIWHWVDFANIGILLAIFQDIHVRFWPLS